MTKTLGSGEIRRFRRKIYDYYESYGRDLPWRKTTDPYAIWVSEVMLQQTQVDRVVPKYEAFLAAFPTVEILAAASLGDVLILWSGLGYNRRAKMLWLAARRVRREFGGVMPTTPKVLQQLEGVGAYTAAAIGAFAYNLPVVVIETNIRSVFITEFFPEETEVLDSQLLPLIDATLDRDNPRKWYNALMDYGTDLKLKGNNPGRKSKHHTKQSAFIGSSREVRGKILHHLTQGKCLSDKNMTTVLPFELGRIEKVMTDLLAEGLVIKRGYEYYLP